MAKGQDYEMENLLNLHGHKFYRDDGYWYQIEVRRVDKTKERPHGMSYSLTLHEKSNKRVYGIDNAHGYDFRKSRFSGRRIVYDHKHLEEKVMPYEYESPAKLVADFFREADEYLNNL